MNRITIKKTISSVKFILKLRILYSAIDRITNYFQKSYRSIKKSFTHKIDKNKTLFFNNDSWNLMRCISPHCFAACGNAGRGECHPAYIEVYRDYAKL